MTTQVFQRGESVPCWAEAKNQARVPFNPSEGVRITLRDPDMVLAKDQAEPPVSIDAKAMTNPETGKYVLYYDSGAVSTLASEITATATSLTVATGEGARFPSSDFFIQIDKEILKCSSRTDDVLTVTRRQKGTTAAAHSSSVSLWRLKGWWHYSCKATDGSEGTERTAITHGSFKLV